MALFQTKVIPISKHQNWIHLIRRNSYNDDKAREVTKYLKKSIQIYPRDLIMQLEYNLEILK